MVFRGGQFRKDIAASGKRFQGLHREGPAGNGQGPSAKHI